MLGPMPRPDALRGELDLRPAVVDALVPRHSFQLSAHSRCMNWKSPWYGPLATCRWPLDSSIIMR